MAQEEENAFGCSYSSGGGGSRGGGGGGSGGGSCRPKKIKPKKVPQRGLGVAQLEKIRIEEEQKNVIAASSPSDTSFLGVQKFRANISPFHNSPPPSSSSNHSSPNALFRHSQSAPNIEILQESCSVSKHSNGEIGSRPILWSGGDFNHHHHHPQHPFVFDLPHEPATPVLPQRSHHFQPPPSSIVSSLSIHYETLLRFVYMCVCVFMCFVVDLLQVQVQVNASCGISPSSVLTSHLEPPSNQSSLPSNYAPQWKEEEKVHFLF